MGLALRAGTDVAERTHGRFCASGMSSRELAARLSRESDIEFAVPDERRHRLTAPNDPQLYLTGPPISGRDGEASGRPVVPACALGDRAVVHSLAGLMMRLVEIRTMMVATPRPEPVVE